MSAGLFMDLLGVRAKWKSGGRVAAEEAFEEFRRSVHHGIEQVKVSSVEKGVFESDSAFLICDTLRTALQIGQSTYLHAFRPPAHESRMWIRGVIMPGPTGTELVTSSHLDEAHPQVKIIKYKSQVLDAIAAEKSGFRGMRLLVGGGEGVGGQHRNKLPPLCCGDKRFRPFLKIKAPAYPEALAGYHDFLWMATEDETVNAALAEHMFHRLRWAAANTEELAHAAVTQVVFNHWNSLRKSGSSYLSKTKA
jgi:hypothetical protein